MRVEEILRHQLDTNTIDHPYLKAELDGHLKLARAALGIDLPIDVQRAMSMAGRRLPTLMIRKVLLVNLPTVNAFAFPWYGNPTVAITSAFPLIARGLTLASFAEQHVFSGLEDIHYLTEPYDRPNSADWPGLVRLANDFSVPEFVSWGLSLPRLPTNSAASARGDLAIILSTQLFMFILFHEWGHIAMKHIIPNTVGATTNVYMELDDSLDTGTSYANLSPAVLLRHANEIEADRFAVNRVYCGFFRSPPAAGLEAYVTPNQRAMSRMSERSRGRLWIFCVGLLFLLFAATRRSRRNMSHPPALFRLREIVDWTRKEVPGHQEERADFDEGCREAIEDLQLIAHRLGLQHVFEAVPDQDKYVQRMRDVRGSEARDLDDD